MEFFGHFRRLTPVQRNTFIACFLGWSLDAFDFFILTFCVSAIATQFQAKVSAVAEAIFLTLAMRPVGAFLFGIMADRFGRRVTLMVDIIAYSVFELASAFAPSLKVLLVTRMLFGIAMGGEWGVGAALAFETLPTEGRGFFSGLLQEGYAVGYLMAALVYGTIFPYVGWRGMFIVGALPAFLVIYIRTKVDESPAWLEGKVARESGGRLGKDILTYVGTFAFLVVLMFAFNSFSHGSQDLYPDISAKGPSLHTANRRVHRYYREPRGSTGRGCFWHMVGEDRAKKSHRHCCAAGDSGDSVVGLFAYRAHAGAGRFCDAVHGAGCVGSDTSASERTITTGRSRDISRIRLSTGKFSIFMEWRKTGASGGTTLWRSICSSNGLDSIDCSCLSGRGDVERAGAQGRRYDRHELERCAKVGIL